MVLISEDPEHRGGAERLSACQKNVKKQRKGGMICSKNKEQGCSY